jgi:hypothetical protein
MKAASLQELKQELVQLPPKKVSELCLKLAKFKKENKELLSYLLFDAHDEHGYVESVKIEMDDQFAELPKANWYLAKKGLRKILKSISKYSKHVASKEAEAEMLLHFLTNLQASGIRYRSYKVLSSLYDTQVKKLAKLANEVHEDLRFDYKRKLDQLR